MLKPKRIIDVGCGDNSFKRLAEERGYHCIGLDFVGAGADVITPIHKTGFKTKAFDLVTAFDVLEHLLPEEVDQVLYELRRISTRYLFSISYNTSDYQIDGQTLVLHQTVREQSWWVAKLKELGTVTRWFRYLYGEWE